MYDLLGKPNRVAMTARDGHSPTPEAMEQMGVFFDRFLMHGPNSGMSK